MKLRVSILVDLVELDHPGHPPTQRIMGKVIEHDYQDKDKAKFITAIKEAVEHIVSYVRTWLD